MTLDNWLKKNIDNELIGYLKAFIHIKRCFKQMRMML